MVCSYGREDIDFINVSDYTDEEVAVALKLKAGDTFAKAIAAAADDS